MRIVYKAALFSLVLFCSSRGLCQEKTDKPRVDSFVSVPSVSPLHDLMLAAARGDGSAARSIGGLYDTGEDVSQDQATALLWYRRAASLGDVTAMFDVAVCYDTGTGTARDPIAAARWYGRAATRRFGRAEYNLGLMYEQGDGVSRNRLTAARLFQAAAQDGIMAARRRLQAIVHTVPRMSPDGDANTAFAVAQHALLERTPQAAAKAATVLTQVAALTGPTAVVAGYDLAWCYENGIGVDKNHRRAYALFVRVAAETDDPALRDLAQTSAAVSDRLPVDPTVFARPSASQPKVPEKPDGSPAAPRG